MGVPLSGPKDAPATCISQDDLELLEDLMLV